MVRIYTAKNYEKLHNSFLYVYKSLNMKNYPRKHFENSDTLPINWWNRYFDQLFKQRQLDYRYIYISIVYLCSVNIHEIFSDTGNIKFIQEENEQRGLFWILFHLWATFTYQRTLLPRIKLLWATCMWLTMDFPTIHPHTITLHLKDFFIPNHKCFHLLKL